jgi:CHASE3 domain sensor protein
MLAGIAAAFVVAIAAAWVQVQALRQASEASDRLERTQLVRLATERLRGAVRTAHADVNNYLLDGAETYLARFNEARQEVGRQMARLEDFSRGEPVLLIQVESLRACAR